MLQDLFEKTRAAVDSKEVVALALVTVSQNGSTTSTFMVDQPTALRLLGGLDVAKHKLRSMLHDGPPASS